MIYIAIMKVLLPRIKITVYNAPCIANTSQVAVKANKKQSENAILLRSKKHIKNTKCHNHMYKIMIEFVLE